LEAKLLTRNDGSFEELKAMPKETSKKLEAGEYPFIKNMGTHGYIIT
jgi:hypothetical protein